MGERDDRNDRGVYAKLQMMFGGDAEVNAARAGYSGAVAIEKRDDRDARAARQVDAAEPGPDPRSVAEDEVFYSFFGEVREGEESSGDAGRLTRKASRNELKPGSLRPTHSRERLRTLEATRETAISLYENGVLSSLEPAQDLHQPDAVVGAACSDLPAPTRRLAITSSSGRSVAGVATTAPRATGRRVLIGIIDVGGFDFAHPDFLVPGHPDQTRFIKIWDQSGRWRGRPRNPRDPEGPPLFDYGSEIDRTHMNAALAAQSDLGVAAWRLEPQSVMRTASHGTHVASIAGGNHSACPHALLAGVLVDVPELSDRRLSFYDTSRIVHAVEYLVALAEDKGVPVSINVSLATNGHAHDASSAGSRWLDAILATPGRSICVAAGNSGQEAPGFAGDLGWIMGRIHSEGSIDKPGLTHDLEWLVVGDGFEDVSENELEIWYSGQDRLIVQLRTPDGDWLPPVSPGHWFRNEPHAYTAVNAATGSRREQRCFVTVINTLYYPSNGANYVALYLSPDLKARTADGRPTMHGVQPGKWLVRILGERVRDGRFHAWIERDDPGRSFARENRRLRRYPSFFSAQSNIDRSSVSSLACGQRVVSVANLDEAADRIHPSSSQGPTRDGRPKPEVAAPGTGIVAARGFSDRSRRWVEMTGTSMASPAVCGLAARMLEVNRQLTAAQIGSILRATARPLPAADFDWRDDAGYGVVDADEALQEAALVGRSDEVDAEGRR